MNNQKRQELIAYLQVEHKLTEEQAIMTSRHWKVKLGYALMKFSQRSGDASSKMLNAGNKL
jgi:hypothetical protein